MANLNGYDATGGETMEDRDVLPVGEYPAALVKSDRKEAKTQGNAYINCEYEVTDGEFKGRRFWGMLNLWNSNTQAVEIAQRELNSIMHACGKLRVDDTEELHGIPMLVKLGVRKSDEYGPQNQIKGYKPLNSGSVAQSSTSQGSGANKPWNQPSA